MRNMPRRRAYASAAEKQAAYRHRAAIKRKSNVTNHGDLDDLVERVRFVRDAARDISQANVANWKGWPGSAELRAFALQDDLDAVVARLTALLEGDSKPFQGAEFERWRRARGSQLLVFAP
jgi:hypothetical protein